MRPYHVATAAIIVLIAAVVMFDTRGGALPDTRGGAPGGLKGGWWPFWAAAVVALAGGTVAVRALVTPQSTEGAFRSRQGVIDVIALVVPMLVLVLLMEEQRLGFYLSTGLYMAYFALVTARYRWYWAILAGLAVPTIVYVVFEVLFRATFPKSFLYPGLPF